MYTFKHMRSLWYDKDPSIKRCQISNYLHATSRHLTRLNVEFADLIATCNLLDSAVRTSMARIRFNKTAQAGDTVILRCGAIMSRSMGLIQWLKHYQIDDSYLSAENTPYVTLLQVIFLEVLFRCSPIECVLFQSALYHLFVEYFARASNAMVDSITDFFFHQSPDPCNLNFSQDS